VIGALDLGPSRTRWREPHRHVEGRRTQIELELVDERPGLEPIQGDGHDRRVLHHPIAGRGVFWACPNLDGIPR
jgi:hypothetical protein